MLEHLMRQSANLYQPVYKQESTQEISHYDLVKRKIPVFIQPASSEIENYYMQRGLTNIHTIYTSDVCTSFVKEQVLTYDGREYHIVGTTNTLTLNIFQVLTAEEYTGAKKRLSIEDYEG